MKQQLSMAISGYKYQKFQATYCRWTRVKSVINMSLFTFTSIWGHH